MKIKLLSIVAAVAALLAAARADEGMFPISELGRIDLRARGLAIDPLQVYNPKAVSLIDAIVQINGGTGSFVSADGLIITNHHIAFGAVQAASSPGRDLVNEGFLAAGRDREIQAKAYTVRITESYREASAQILSAVKPKMDFAKRTKRIETAIKELIIKTEKKNPGKRAEVAEMFPGKTYILFLYTYLKDVRLVYAPPRGIGDFGGEADNWAWPRHAGDFSFLRAYVGPDGQPADYSEKNIPYKPRKFLKIAAAGVLPGDFVFLLGYPGRTYRHMTSHYLAYEQEMRMPAVADLYSWQIAEMERMSAGDPAAAIKLAGRIKGLANTMKNYRSKVAGMKRLGLVERKREDEKKLRQFITADKVLVQKYGTLFDESEKIYSEMAPWLEHELILDNLPRMVTLLNMASVVNEAAIELRKKESDRESAYMSRNFNRTKEGLKLALKNYHPPLDKLFLKELLTRAARLPADRRIPAVERICSGQDPAKAIAGFIDKAYGETGLADESTVMAWLEKTQAEVEKSADPLLVFARELYPSILKLRELRRQRRGKLDQLYAGLIDAKRLFLRADFIPDANSTLRLTCGHIKGYSPTDAVFYNPITTLRGVAEKQTGKWPFAAPQKELELLARGDFGRFGLPDTSDLPVDILYDADTTGGNSGSPVLNARGELVGVNFDRTGEATINDYTWSPEYSRSIAVDIRYALWVTLKFAGAADLLEEMGVSR